MSSINKLYSPTSATEQLFNLSLWKTLPYGVTAGAAVGASYAQYKEVKGDGGVDMLDSAMFGASIGGGLAAVTGVGGVMKLGSTIVTNTKNKMTVGDTILGGAVL